MTINIALVTAEALIMGCDSMASIQRYVIDPFASDFVRDGNGDPIKDSKGRYMLPVTTDDIEPVVDTLLSGVTKMFLVHENPNVVATTAGAAKLNDQSMKALADEFRLRQKNAQRKLVNVGPVAKAFLSFMRQQFTKQFKNSNVPRQFRQGPEFLVGGYGRDDSFPSLHRVIVADNVVEEEFEAGSFGLSWNGQADSIERIIRGYDSSVKEIVESQVDIMFDRHHANLSETVVKTLEETLAKLGVELPDDFDVSLPTQVRGKLPWSDAGLSIDYSNMPLQNAVDFVSWLVLTQSGRAKFAKGLPTVGGRTHVGIVTKSDGLRMIGEPELEHRYTGFAHDL